MITGRSVEAYESQHGDGLAHLLRACGLLNRAEEIEAAGALNFDVLVALEDGDAVGYIHFQTTGTYSEQFGLTDHPEPQVWVFGMAVTPDRRGSGVGALLLRELAQRVQVLGRTYLALQVDFRGDVERRIAFFNRQGLSWVDRESRAMGAPIARILGLDEGS